MASSLVSFALIQSPCANSVKNALLAKANHRPFFGSNDKSILSDCGRRQNLTTELVRPCFFSIETDSINHSVTCTQPSSPIADDRGGIGSYFQNHFPLQFASCRIDPQYSLISAGNYNNSLDFSIGDRCQRGGGRSDVGIHRRVWVVTPKSLIRVETNRKNNSWLRRQNCDVSDDVWSA